MSSYEILYFDEVSGNVSSDNVVLKWWHSTKEHLGGQSLLLPESINLLKHTNYNSGSSRGRSTYVKVHSKVGC